MQKTLGQIYFDKTKLLPSDSLDCDILTLIADLLDEHDVPTTIQKVREKNIATCKARLEDPKYARRQDFYKERIECYEKWLKDLQDTYGKGEQWKTTH